MSKIAMPVSIPLDADGFLRRECPNCEREFKWRPTQPGGGAESAPDTPAQRYFCPYCYKSAARDMWWTKAQVEYLKQMALAKAIAPELNRLKATTDAMNRTGGFLKINARVRTVDEPEPPADVDDMSLVGFPCHPEESIKVDDRWHRNVACLVCGSRYPVTLVRPKALTQGSD